MDTLVHVVAGIGGALVVVITALSAVQTVVVPRGIPVLITRWVFLVVRIAFGTVAGPRRGYHARDRIMALYAPAALLSLVGAWLLLVLGGYMLVYWAVGVGGWHLAFTESGSSLLTLGFQIPRTVATTVLVFSEAAIGLGLVALLISYLPSIYGSYSRREVMVTALSTQAGSPPSAVELLERLARIEGLDRLRGFWHDWAVWFADIEETHSSTPALVFFRSPDPDRHWVTAAGAILDTAALVASTLDAGREAGAELCIRAGYLSLRRIADFYVMPYDPDPRPTDPIRISREEFDDACERLAASGAPLRTDRDRAWRDFAGWRVNYEQVLLRFAAMCMTPEAPWITDRLIPFSHAPLRRRRPRSRL